MNGIKDNTPQGVSHLIQDPFVRLAFERAERDLGGAIVLPAEPEPGLDGGAAAELVLEMAP